MDEKIPYTTCGQRRPRSACAFAQAYLGLRYPLTESGHIVVYVDEQRIFQIRVHGCAIGVPAIEIRLYILTSLNCGGIKPLQKHAYSNIQEISPPKTENFQIKNSDIFFHISAQKHRLWDSLEPPRRGGSNEYPQSMF